MMKGNKPHTGNKLNKLTDKFAKIHNDGQINKIEIERIDTRDKGDAASSKY